MAPSVNGGLKVYSNGHGPLIKMAVMSIYGKNFLKIYFSRTKKASRLIIGIQHHGLKVYQVCSNVDPRLTFDLFSARSNLRPHAVVWGKG